MKHAVVVFTKVPKDGTSKSRLSDAFGGNLTVTEAREFYEASLLDTMEACVESNIGEVYLCCNKIGDRQYMDEFLNRFPYRDKIAGVFWDKGENFDHSMDYAAECIFKNGNDRLADSVIIVSGDIPFLIPKHLKDTGCELERLGQKPDGTITPALVESPCQEAGSNLLGYTYNTPFNFGGVFYNMEFTTTLDMLAAKAEKENIPFAAIDMVPDVDLPQDLDATIPLLKALGYAAKFDDEIKAPRRTIAYMEKLGLLKFPCPL